MLDCPAFTRKPLSALSLTTRRTGAKLISLSMLKSSALSFLPALIRLPAVQAMGIQAATVLLLLLSQPVLVAAKISVSFSVTVLAQAVIAALLSRWRGQALWWQAIHLLFLPAVVLCLFLALPPWLFLVGFLLLLAVFWSTFRTQVPFYASGRVAWAAIVAELPAGPLRIIDIGSGIGGLAINVAQRRPDCRVEGIELAPLPWCISRMRELMGAPCRFHRGDYGRLHLGGYDVVVAYLSPAAMPALWIKAKREMRAGTMLLSHEFSIPGVRADIQRETRPGGPVLYGWLVR